MADERSSWHDALRSLDSDACDDLSECAVQRNWSAALDALSESADSQELEADGACKQGDWMQVLAGLSEDSDNFSQASGISSAICGSAPDDEVGVLAIQGRTPDAAELREGSYAVGLLHSSSGIDPKNVDSEALSTAKVFCEDNCTVMNVTNFAVHLGVSRDLVRSILDDLAAVSIILERQLWSDFEKRVGKSHDDFLLEWLLYIDFASYDSADFKVNADEIELLIPVALYPPLFSGSKKAGTNK